MFFLLTFCPGSFAEDITNETQNLRTEELRVKQASRAAEKSKEKAADDKFKTGVTYEDILKDPDNIGLNARYAQEQIARGELLSAAATLEGCHSGCHGWRSKAVISMACAGGLSAASVAGAR